MAVEAEVARDRRQERARPVEHGGAAEAGRELLRGRDAADLLAALEDQRFPPGLRQVARRDEAVGAAADDRDPLVFRHIVTSGPSELPVAQDLLGGVLAVRAHDAAAGMRRRAAHIEVANRRRVLRPSRGRPQKEQLLERQLALEDVAFRQAPLALEIERRQHLAVQNDVPNVGRVLGDRVDDGVAERFALGVPVASFRWYGAYCTKQDMTCLPGGASDGSVRLGITMSM